MKSTLVIFCLLLIASCGEKSQKELTEQSEAENTANVPQSFVDGLKAHGGLDMWNSFGTLKFTEVTDTDTSYYTLDLKNRNELIEKIGEFKVGFTADTMTFYPNRDSFPGENPEFTHNLRFYFVAIHFVTADPGVFQTELPPAELNGKRYNRVKITFDDGVGIAPKDQYVLWYEQTTKMLEVINYSVTYFDESKAEKYSAIVYKDWREYNGVKMPGELTSYYWENDSLGEMKYSRKYSDYVLSANRPDSAVFVNLSADE